MTATEGLLLRHGPLATLDARREPGRPRLLDLFCGAGGAGAGYAAAGFEVVGVDIKPQPHYPFRFIQADVLDLMAWKGPLGFIPDVIHASPPCQAFSAGGNLWASRLGSAMTRHPNLIGPTRDLIQATGLPYVIENVERAKRWLIEPHLICGRALGLGVKRHRLFESSELLFVPPCPTGHPGEWISVFGGGGLTRTPPGGQRRIDGKHNGRGANDGRVHVSHAEASVAMGIDWMTRDELSESIPPAYTEWIGTQLRASLERAA
jgi:DNA (cytosine-5)-methyltransferase 1